MTGDVQTLILSGCFRPFGSGREGLREGNSCNLHNFAPFPIFGTFLLRNCIRFEYLLDVKSDLHFCVQFFCFKRMVRSEYFKFSFLLLVMVHIYDVICAGSDSVVRRKLQEGGAGGAEGGSGRAGAAAGGR